MIVPNIQTLMGVNPYIASSARRQVWWAWW